MSALELRSVGKSYQNQQVLQDINLQVRPGEFIILIGPSGCGKSTLLRMIAGLEDITEGDLLMNGEVVNKVPPQKRNISMVFQSYALYPHLTVYDNISFGMQVRKIPKEQYHDRVIQTARMLNLEPYLKRLPGQLSGGQRQRVAMGRSIIRNPDFFLFDEPLSNLDAKLRVQMRSEIKEIHNAQQVTTIYVTHDQAEAMTLADRVVVLNGGTIEQIGTPLELYDHPNNVFVASFLGSPAINLLDGEFVDGKFTFNAAGATPVLDLSSKVLEGAKIGAIQIGVRPEHFELSNNESDIPVTVSHVESMGAESNIFGHIGEQQVIITCYQRVNLSRGDTCYVTIHYAQMHVFDQNTGLRISR